MAPVSYQENLQVSLISELNNYKFDRNNEINIPLNPKHTTCTFSKYK